MFACYFYEINFKLNMCLHVLFCEENLDHTILSESIYLSLLA